LILVDANLLIYAVNAAVPQHAAAQAWLDARLNSTTRVGLPWASLLAFLRLVTNPRVFQRPLSMSDAWNQVDAWLGIGSAWVPTPTERHAGILARLLAAPGVHGNLVPDAHLAALAIEHGLELNSTDGDFARFVGLKWCNPLALQGNAG
jgi:toxin-antitoxin system PIN domain toxin